MTKQLFVGQKMPKDDFWAGLGTIVSAIMAALSWLWNIGPLQLLFSFSTGALFTYIVQARLQDRAEKRQVARQNFALMRETIYGPLFGEINQISEDLKSFEISHLEEIDKIMDRHLYFMVALELRKLIEGFCERVRRYTILEGATVGVAEQISLETSRENLERPAASSDFSIVYRLFVGNNLIKMVYLVRALLQDRTPNEILKEEAAGLTAVSINITVGGYSYPSIEDVHKTCKIALQKIRSTPMFQERESERKYLISEAEKIINRLKQFITL